MNNEKIIDKLTEENFDSMFVFKPENIKYISDFYPTSFAYLVIANDEPILYVNSIDKQDAEAQSKIETYDIKKLSEIKDLLVGNIAVEGSVDFEYLKYLTNDISKLKMSDAIEKARMIKTSDEIDKIRKSIEIASKSIYEIDFTKSEKYAAATLEFNMNINGSNNPAFDTIVASAVRSSSPHSVPTDNKVETPIVVDWGARYDHYCSDITRTFIDTERQEEIWDIVLEAQKAAYDVVAPGVKCSDVDKAARDVIADYGYGDYFIHSTGHSFGLDIHESPNISFNNDSLLEENMVITIEPGIYIPGELGVRIEDDVLVSNNPEVLTRKLPKKLDFVI
ncbi:aminopeptidase P family protein [uncultured Methanosphaera sp.]|uniref:M24 family metallopeptidase n=1 Tax=uncultured Methanosphaera sp. TaxID=262501 RepID=UPI002804FA39|nr:aminopeptidase P family protein [uncultured Methanosphaera sp.]